MHPNKYISPAHLFGKGEHKTKNYQQMANCVCVCVFFLWLLCGFNECWFESPFIGTSHYFTHTHGENRST